jgi:hypothetical protein
VTEGKVLERQRPLRPEERPGGSDEASEDVQHGPAAMPGQSEIFKDFAADEFLVTTGCQNLSVAYPAHPHVYDAWPHDERVELLEQVAFHRYAEPHELRHAT